MSQPFALHDPDAELEDCATVSPAPTFPIPRPAIPWLTERASTTFAALRARSRASGPHNSWFVVVCRWFTRKDGNGKDF